MKSKTTGTSSSVDYSRGIGRRGRVDEHTRRPVGPLNYSQNACAVGYSSALSDYVLNRYNSTPPIQKGDLSRNPSWKIGEACIPPGFTCSVEEAGVYRWSSDSAERNFIATFTEGPKAKEYMEAQDSKYLDEIAITRPAFFLKEMTPRAKLSSADQAAELGLDLNLPYHRKLQAEYADKVLAVQRRLNQPAESTPRFNPADPEAKGAAARGSGRPPKMSASSTLSLPTFEHLSAELAGAKIEAPPISSSAAEAVGAPAIVCPETPYKAIKFEVDAAGKKVVLGKGGGGTVYRASYMGVRVAVKELHLDQELTAAKELAFRKEASIHSGIRHPNILLLMAVCLEAGHLALVMEYMDNGSLYNFLQSTKEISWAERKRLAREMAAGLVCLHSLNIAHRDLKSLNVLLDEYCRAKLADFGLSVVKLNSLPSKFPRGTPCWVAPEVIAQRIMTIKSDIYSLGVILWELASREVPYSGVQIIAEFGIVQGITNEIPPETPTAFAKVISNCWKLNPKERPSAEEVLAQLKGC